jgi:probable F420-dependent oxidoreductase
MAGRRAARFDGLTDNPPMPSFRFLADARAPASARDLADTARRAESLGYSHLAIPDHLIDQLSPVPAMTAIAAATTTLRVSTFVLNNDLRHPAVLAQDLASVDVLSEGRLDIAIGAGWNEAEYGAIGIVFDKVGRRVARLAEAVAVLKGCFAPGPFSFSGRHYTITDYDGRPAPAQQPHPPFMIGGGGRRVLSLAAREAQIVGVAPRIQPDGRLDPRSLTWAATEEKLAWVRADAGDRFDELTLNVYPSAWPVTVTSDIDGEARRVVDSLRARTGIELTEQEVIESPHLFIGSIERFLDKFRDLRDRLGISSIMVGEPGPLDRVVEQLAGT